MVRLGRKNHKVRLEIGKDLKIFGEAGLRPANSSFFKKIGFVLELDRPSPQSCARENVYPLGLFWVMVK